MEGSHVRRGVDAILAAMDDSTVVDSARTSLVSAAVSALVATVFGLPLAYGLARAETRWRSAVLATVVLPLVLPPTVGGIVLLPVVGPNTLNAATWSRQMCVFGCFASFSGCARRARPRCDY